MKEINQVNCEVCRLLGVETENLVSIILRVSVGEIPLLTETRIFPDGFGGLEEKIRHFKIVPLDDTNQEE